MKPANTFFVHVQRQFQYRQLELEIAALANALAKPFCPNRRVLTSQTFEYWLRVAAAFCQHISAAKKTPAALPDGGVAARLWHFKKVCPATKNVCYYYGRLVPKMERAEDDSASGLTSDSPVNTMNYLVLGSQEWSEMNGGIASRKVQKAAELQKRASLFKLFRKKNSIRCLMPLYKTNPTCGAA